MNFPHQCGQEKCPPKTVMAMIVANDRASSEWNPRSRLTVRALLYLVG
jgi:hypothetical protein